MSTSNKSSIGDRMKLYEGLEADRILMPLAPTLARLDGRAFHTFTRGLKRPFDDRMHRMMVETTRYLVEETGALVGYTQSDEISLAWKSDDIKSQILFDGRTMKMVSVLASMATARFNQILPDYIAEKTGRLPVFDCRVWNVPNEVEAANYFLWRDMDATRNSIQMAGQAVFSHRSLQGLNVDAIKDKLLVEKGINWNDYHPSFKRGTWIRKQRVVRPYTGKELEQLPAKHNARQNPNLMVERWNISELEMPPFRRVSNRVEVVFEGADPIERSDEQPTLEEVI